MIHMISSNLRGVVERKLLYDQEKTVLLRLFSLLIIYRRFLLKLKVPFYNYSSCYSSSYKKPLFLDYPARIDLLKVNNRNT